MKLKTFTCVAATTLFAALANPVRLAAQEQSQQQGQQEQKHHRYRLVDIGTFGGPASHVSGDNGVNGATLQAVNNQGVFAGTAETSATDPNAPNCGFTNDCFVAHAFQWQKGILTDLGTLPGGQSSDVKAISGNGLVAGQSQIGVMDPLAPGFPEFHPVLWENGKIIDLGTLGGNDGAAFAVNDRGQAVGATLNTIPDPFSYLGTQIRAFIWENGVMQDLGTLGGPQGWALFVNESGQVAGFSTTNFTANPTTDFPTVDPFLWEKGKMLDLGTLGGTIGSPHGLNNRGQVVGASNVAGDLAEHPFLWDRGVLTDLGTFGGDNGSAEHINDAGDVVGNAYFPGNQLHDAFLWKRGVMTDLGNLGATSFAHWINAKGQVVGTSRADPVPGPGAKVRAFLWENGGPMVDLNTLIPPNSSLTLVQGYIINDRGEIAGVGVPPGVLPQDYETAGHAFVLIPCHENDVEGCKERAEGTPAAAQINPAPVAPATQPPTMRTQSRPTPREGVSLRDRLSPRYRLPSVLAEQPR